MQRRVPGGGRRRGLPADVAQIDIHFLSPDDGRETALHRIPGSLVLRLFLHPDSILDVGISAQHGLKIQSGKGVHLFDSDDGDVFDFPLTPRSPQIVKDLPRAQHNALHLVGVQRIGLVNNGLKGTLGKFLKLGDGCFVPEQAFWRHYDQELA